MKNFAFFDFDLTLSKGFSGIELIDYLHRVGVCSDKLYNEKSKAMEQYGSGRLSYYDFVTKFGHIWAAIVKGKKRKDISKFAMRFFKEYKNNIYKESYALIKELKNRNYYVIVISSAPYELIELTSKSLGADKVYAYEIRVKNGQYTGKVKTPLDKPKSKERLMLKLSQKYDLSKSFGFGDSISDLGILKHVGIPVALNAGKELEKFARDSGWLILDKNNVVKEVKKIIK